MYQTFIVDDEHAIRSGLRQIIPWEEYGVEICGEASNGLEALRFITEHQPDLVICDIRMPVMDGLELVKHVHEKGIPSRFILLSGYDDFQYVKEAIKYNVENYLLKPVNVEELKQTVHQVTKKLESELLSKIRDMEGKEMIKNNILNRIVNRQISSYEFKNKLSLVNLNMSLIESSLRIAVIDFLGDGAGRPEIPPELLQSIGNVSSQMIGPDKGVNFMDFTGRIVIIFTLGDGDPGIEQIRSYLQTIYDRSPVAKGIHWIITVGNTVNSYKDLHISYQNALSIQQYRLYYQEGDIIFLEDVMAKRADERHSVIIDHHFIEDSIKAGKHKEMTDYVHSCFERLSRKGANPDSVYTMVMEIVISMLRTIRSSGIDPSEIFDDENRLLNTVNEFKDMGKLQQWLHKKLDATLSAIEFRNKSNLSKVTKDLINCIDNRYNEDLSLKTLSREFHFNSVYIGRLFRNETGEVFSEYVNRVRIEKSMQHLRNTNRKINDIAKSVGFSNANYFYAIFKEMTGMTPTEFRNR